MHKNSGKIRLAANESARSINAAAPLCKSFNHNDDLDPTDFDGFRRYSRGSK